MTAKIIAGKRTVRIRPTRADIGPFDIRMWIVTDLDSRKPLGIKHISRQAAARWADAQGWRYLGTQEHGANCR